MEINHTTVWRWVQRYAPELEERTRPHLKPANKSWRVDETYVRVKGRWFYGYVAKIEERTRIGLDSERGSEFRQPGRTPDR